MLDELSHLLPGGGYNSMYVMEDGEVHVEPVDFWCILDCGEQGSVLSAIYLEEGYPDHINEIDRPNNFIGFLRPGELVPSWAHEKAKKRTKGDDTK